MTAALALQPPSPPRTRAECQGGPRPCPWKGCFWHLPPNPTPHTCSLDVADAGGTTHEVIGLIFGLSKQRIDQIETKAIVKLRGRPAASTAARAADETVATPAPPDPPPSIRCANPRCQTEWCHVGGAGRHRRFCSTECRTASYYRSQALTEE